GVQGLAVEQARTRTRERGRELIRAYPLEISRNADDPQASRTSKSEYAEVGGRFDEQRVAGAGERADSGGQSSLAARAEQHVVLAERSARGTGGGRASEPGPKIGAPFDRAARPRSRLPSRASQRRAEGGRRLKLGVEIATGQRNGTFGR